METITQTLPVHFTENAIAEIKRIYEKESAEKTEK